MNKKIKIIGIITIIIIVIVIVFTIIYYTTNNKKITLIKNEINTTKIQSLNEFTETNKISISSKINKLLKQNDFQVYTCESGSGEDHGLVLNITLFKQYDNLYRDTVSFMLEWEKTLVKDTYNELLPNIDSNTVNANFISLDQNTRYVEVYTTTKTKKYYNYSLIPDAIIISSSLDCTKELISYYYPSDVK
jgi:hypothetical protein